MAKAKKVRMTNGLAVATPLADQVPLWEKQGWVQDLPPETAPDDGAKEKPHKEK